MIEWSIQVSQLRDDYRRAGLPDAAALDQAVAKVKSMCNLPARRKSSQRCERMVRPLSLEQWERRHGKGARR
jgi:hypothetical protein